MMLWIYGLVYANGDDVVSVVSTVADVVTVVSTVADVVSVVSTVADVVSGFLL